MLPRSPRSAFVRTFFLSLAIGLTLIWLIAPLAGVGRGFGGTVNDGYLELGANLIRGHGYVFEAGGAAALHRPPVYPFLIAPLTLLPVPLQRPLLVVAQSAGLAALCAIAFVLAHMVLGLATARAAIAVLWLDPVMFWVVKQPMVFVLQALLALVFVWLLGRLLRGDERPGLRGSVELGALGAALALTHGAMLASVCLLLGGSALVALWSRRRPLVWTSAGAGLLVLLLISPWTYRNFVVSGHLIPVAGAAGYAYFQSNAMLGIGAPPQGADERRAVAALRHAGLPARLARHEHFMGIVDAELDAELTRKMVAHATAHPDQLARKIVRNAFDFYFPVLRSLDGVEDFSKWGGRLDAQGKLRRLLVVVPISLFHALVWGLVLYALWRARASPRALRPRLALLAALLCLVVPYWPFVVLVGELPQYTSASMALLAVLAGSTFEADPGS